MIRDNLAGHGNGTKFGFVLDAVVVRIVPEERGHLLLAILAPDEAGGWHPTCSVVNEPVNLQGLGAREIELSVRADRGWFAHPGSHFRRNIRPNGVDLPFAGRVIDLEAGEPVFV